MLIKDILHGIRSYLNAARFISTHRLWPYLILPSLISLLLGVGIFLSAWGLSDNIGQIVLDHYPWNWGRDLAGKIASVAGGVLVLAAGLLLYKNLVLILAGPFMSPLSEKVESILTGREREIKFSLVRAMGEFVRGLRIALRNIIRELFFTILLLILGLIPVFSPFTTATIFLVQSFYAGFGNFDFYLERHLNIPRSVEFIRGHKGLVLGNGIVFIGLLLSGIGFLIAPALGAVAATMEGCKRLDHKPAAEKDSF